MTEQAMVSVLGLDVGSKRIGVAGCDGTGLIATGLTTVQRRRLDVDFAQLRDLATHRQAEALVVGLPRNMNGTLGPQAEKVQHFGDLLGQRLGLPVHYEDERLTTVQAKRSLLAQNLPALKRRALVDQQAACFILQQWLNRRQGYLQEQVHE
ncbi:Holliday junction resolvase RuvX [Candidatus Cyanaurora vandensis]|uniref:Holliday junction resolvase RuvX n=1 Tax=Candidatus Cyanaurora vandensis TaxID=2714958 RepID=UPI00257A5F2D|nr:Holliday junction resolvase RuvX [Candidatus Cyanaurora vandensis]